MSLDLDTVANISQIASIVIPVGFSAYAIWRRIDKRQTDSYVATVRVNDKIDAMQKQLDLQFGGNGGGIREAINTMKEDQKVMDRKLDRACADIANLQGKFDQHIQENP